MPTNAKYILICHGKQSCTLSSLTLPVEEALEALILISQNKAEISKALQQKTKDLSPSLFPPISQSKILLVGKNPPKHIVKEQR